MHGESPTNIFRPLIFVNLAYGSSLPLRETAGEERLYLSLICDDRCPPSFESLHLSGHCEATDYCQSIHRKITILQ